MPSDQTASSALEHQIAVLQRATRAGLFRYDFPASGEPAKSWVLIPPELIGRPPGPALNIDNATAVVGAAAAERFETALLAAAAGSASTWSYEPEVPGRDGSRRCLRVIADIERDREGKARSVVGSIQDVTAEKAAAERLADITARLDLILQAADACMFRFHIAGADPANPAHQRVESNTWMLNASALYEFGEGEIPTPAQYFEFVHPDDRDLAIETRSRAMRAGLPQFEAEYRLVRRDGSEHWILSKCQIEYENGQPTVMTGIQFDITERKRSEQRIAH